MISSSAHIRTVSGAMDSETNQERLYRSCEFEGSDTWWLLRR